MANEIRCRHTAGQNLYAIIWSGNTVWNGSAFVSPVAGNWGTYDLPMTEVTISGAASRYSVSFPVGITDAGQYVIELYIRAGGSPAVSDELFGDPATLDWDGAKQVSAANQFAAASIVDGKTPAQALQIIGAKTAGKVSGAGTGTEVFKGLDGSTTRATETVDNQGNRTAIVYG